ncbi:hypothetical protein AAE02nite_43020 [Adhaeribacter aerolatus]|uniref:Uncharacterized protein n=1 Tax=Adhaeribacter aerolatus TaxID=670289 RepID=A0A512B3V4_9BACT|nr:hypothetical protein [Adhaeribacter aerolatus]GEO06638.1 hypothetical protein AAE02nite_43020 [Adhaeribacter aerolatus]
MKTNTWMKESSVKNEAKEVKAAECKSNVCGRTYDEETSFSQINFQTFQDILDKRNELLNSVKHQ